MKTLLQVDHPAGETGLGQLQVNSSFHFSLQEGQVISFLEGKNPTLLFRFILNLGKLTAGKIEFPLRDENQYRPHTYLGLAPREKGLISNLTILENVSLPARYHNYKEGETSAEDLAKKCLNDLGVEEKYWDLRPDHVSWEMRKKTLLARSVVCNPKIVILEDPTNMLSWNKLPQLYAWIKKQKNEQRGILLCSENIPFALSVCDVVWDQQLKKSIEASDYLETRGKEWQFLVKQMKTQMGSEIHAT